MEVKASVVSESLNPTLSIARVGLSITRDGLSKTRKIPVIVTKCYTGGS